jgi:hypothetical protein
MTDEAHGGTDESRSVDECLADLHHNIEGMVKVPRLPSALRLMLIVARAQIDELRTAIERDLPSGPSEASFTRRDHGPR